MISRAVRCRMTMKTQLSLDLNAAVKIKSNRLSSSQARWNPFYKLGVSGNCRARVELKVWGVKEHPQWEDEEQRAAEECEGGVEWDEKDCWLKRARPNGWVDRAYTDWVKSRVALFCFPPSLIVGLNPSAVTTSASTSSRIGSPPASIFLAMDDRPTAHHQHLPTASSTAWTTQGFNHAGQLAQTLLNPNVSHI